jgi:predicted transcriptional regulator
MPQLSKTSELTNVQSQLLKMFAYDLPEEEWVDLQKMLARFFAQRVKQRTAKIWEERGYTNQTMDNWLNGKTE